MSTLLDVKDLSISFGGLHAVDVPVRQLYLTFLPVFISLMKVRFFWMAWILPEKIP